MQPQNAPLRVRLAANAAIKLLDVALRAPPSAAR